VTQSISQQRITLGEGATPMLRSRSIGPSVGLENLHFKLESLNPTGSYKDRFAAAAVSNLVSEKATVCLGCSSGNTGAALAAYSAAVDLPCILAIVDSAPEAKLRQMQIYGATLARVKGFGTDASMTQSVSDGLANLAADLGTTVQISAFCYAPIGMAGVQSISREIADSSILIQHVFSPAGGGGLTLAVCRGFDASDLSPSIHCVQPKGNDTIASPLREGHEHARSVECTTSISGLQVANVMDGNETVAACRRSGGTGHTVADEFVFEIQKRLAREEGIFSEPAGAVAVAGALLAAEKGEIASDTKTVCLVTGSGFKDDVSQTRMLESAGSCPSVDSFGEFESIVRKTLRQR
jgi:threonine synthase